MENIKVQLTFLNDFQGFLKHSLEIVGKSKKLGEILGRGKRDEQICEVEFDVTSLYTFEQ